MKMKMRIMGQDRSDAGTVFFGSEGKIFIQAWEDVVNFEPQQLRYDYYEQTRRIQRSSPELQLVNNHLENFLNCIRTRQTPNAELSNGCNSVILPLLGIIILTLNRPLRWDPVKREFLNDKSANRYLTKSSRVPWRLG